jgi:hypothetical protein
MQVAFGNEDWAALESLSESMLNTPEGSSKIAPLLMASRAAMKLRASERAIPRLQRAIAMLEAQEQETNNVLWDLITAASIQEEWALVREAGTKLGMKFESEDGPIEENWGAVRLRFREEHDYVYYLAQRTGPATARVFQPAWPKAQQHLGDSVVFDVELLNTLRKMKPSGSILSVFMTLSKSLKRVNMPHHGLLMAFIRARSFLVSLRIKCASWVGKYG